MEHKNKVEHKFNKQNFFEAFLNLMISSLFASLYLLAVACYAYNSEADFMGNTYYFCIIAFFVSGLVFQALLDLFSESKKRAGLHIRILFFWILIVVAACYLLKQIYAPYYLIPGMILEYIFTALLNKTIYFQDKFLKQIEPWEGKDLGPNLRADSITVETLNKSMDTNRLFLLITCIVIFGGAYVVNHFEKRIDSPQLIILMIVFAVLYLLCVAFLFAVYNVFQKNTYFAFLGFKNVMPKKWLILKYSLVVIFLSVLLGGVLSRDKALIKLNIIPQQKQYEYKEPKKLEQSEYSHFEDDVKVDLEDTLGKINSNPVMDKLMIILYWVVLFGCVGFFIFMFFHYIITNRFIAFFREHMLLKILKEIWKNICQFFANLFGLGKHEKEVYATVNSRTFKSHIDNLVRKTKKSAEKKQELDRLTKKFMQIIAWGDKNNIKYRNTMAPAEYIAEVEKKTDGVSGALQGQFTRIGYLYEKSLYSNELLAPQEEKEYFELAAKLVATEL